MRSNMMRDLEQVTKSINLWSETLINTRHKVSNKKRSNMAEYKQSYTNQAKRF